MTKLLALVEAGLTAAARGQKAWHVRRAKNVRLKRLGQQGWIGLAVASEPSATVQERLAVVLA